MKHLEMDKYFIIPFPVQRHLAFWKDLFFVLVSFTLIPLIELFIINDNNLPLIKTFNVNKTIYR